MIDVSDLTKLSMTLEIFGLALAWGETRRPAWFVSFDEQMDKVAEADLGDVLSLMPFILEYVVFAFLVWGVLLFGLSFESEDFKYLYGTAFLLVLSAPFLVKKMKLFSGGNSMATLGLIVAGAGVAVQVAQWL
ncbi:hypothetical protein ACLD02_06030 [Alloalcanivorax sp. C16-2]|uniref:hypothetical protein n=1 Tax=Alloalcanivorax sp. C16-2 TaxID=3390052 RepID=UPI003970EE28